MLDEMTGTLTSGQSAPGGHKRRKSLGQVSTVNYADRSENAGQLYGDSGGASRFFFRADYDESEVSE